MDDLSFQELDAKLIELQESRAPIEREIERLGVEIEFLEDEKNDSENKLIEIDNQIKSIKKKIHEDKVKSLDVFTDDQFTNDFIRASYFCSREDGDRPIYNFVNLTDSEIIATNCFILIKINSNCIPENLKNTRIKWDVRKDFEQHINREVKPIPNYGKILGEAEKTHRLVAEKMKASDFWNVARDITHTPETKYMCAMVHFKIGNLSITFNKEYLNTGLMGMGDEEFTVYAHANITPMILQGTRTTVIALPMKP